ncbi:hypothetical protein [Streptococcus sp. S784/96/1]|uniref:hypothetical protein n=1 Tax=Streptococcus sp. S784/96/1 TaxID=2653499 RepID=UPI001389EA95|nr:hypothetical protein [Streptococcus sp. S784/96/1]
MTFRKTADEYIKQPVGTLSPYKEGTYIDSENNVYIQEGLQYIKIGYDVPLLDTYVQHIPMVSVGVLLANAFAPKRRAGESRGLVEVIIGFLLALYFLLWYNLLAWVGYRILSLFPTSLISLTEKKKWIRLFLPFTWFVDFPNKNQVAVAAGSIMLIPYALFAIPLMALASYDAPELMPVAIIVILFALLSGFYLFVNVRINKKNLVDKL